MSSSNQGLANRGFRSLLRCAISHYRQVPSLSAPEPGWIDWFNHRWFLPAGRSHVITSPENPVRFRSAPFKPGLERLACATPLCGGGAIAAPSG